MVVGFTELLLLFFAHFFFVTAISVISALHLTHILLIVRILFDVYFTFFFYILLIERIQHQMDGHRHGCRALRWQYWAYH